MELGYLGDLMNLQTISIEQLKQVISIKEKIASLESQLAKLTGGKALPAISPEFPVKKTRKGMSAAGKARIAAAQKARWAKVKSKAPAATAATPAAKPAVVKDAKPAKKAKRTLSPEGRAKIVAALKKRWAAKKKS